VLMLGSGGRTADFVLLRYGHARCKHLRVALLRRTYRSLCSLFRFGSARAVKKPQHKVEAFLLVALVHSNWNPLAAELVRWNQALTSKCTIWV